MTTTSLQRVVSNHHFAEVRRDANAANQYLYSTMVFEPGNVICNFSAAAVFTKPTYLTVQTDDDTHITLLPVFLQYINHSCSPNVFFDTSSFQVICIATILPGDQFTFFYPSTEWQMVQAFSCRCGSINCIGQIAGAAATDRAILSRYRLTDFIKKKLQKVRG